MESRRFGIIIEIRSEKMKKPEGLILLSNLYNATPSEFRFYI